MKLIHQSALLEVVMDYDAQISVVHQRYKERISALMQRIEDAFVAECYISLGTIYWYDEERRWSLTLAQPDDPPTEDGPLPETAVDISFTVVEERCCEDHNGTRIAFSLNFVKVGGEIIGGMTPHNYSPQLWLAPTDLDAIEARFKLFEELDTAECVRLCRRKE